MVVNVTDGPFVCRCCFLMKANRMFSFWFCACEPAKWKAEKPKADWLDGHRKIKKKKKEDNFLKLRKIRYAFLPPHFLLANRRRSRIKEQIKTMCNTCFPSVMMRTLSFISTSLFAFVWIWNQHGPVMFKASGNCKEEEKKEKFTYNFGREGWGGGGVKEAENRDTMASCPGFPTFHSCRYLLSMVARANLECL